MSYNSFKETNLITKLPKSEVQAFHELAKQQGTSSSKLLRDLVRAYLKTAKKADQS